MTELTLTSSAQHALEGMRPYRPDDLLGLLRLLEEAEAWPPAGKPTEDQLEHRWNRRGVQPEQHVQVVEDASGAFIAYWYASPWGDSSGRLGFDIAVHPGWRNRGVGSTLLRLVETEARRAGAARTTCPVFVSRPNDVPQGAVFLSNRGFRSDHGYWQMTLSGIAGQATPRWPQGITVRPFGDLEADVPRWCSLVVRAFGEETTPSGVLSQLAEPGASVGSYFFAVDQATGREIGTSRARIDVQNGERVGYIGTIGVLPEYRRRGIAEALVRHTLGHLAKDGVTRATLFVERNNSAARRLYDAMGWRPVYRTDHYWKALANPDDLTADTHAQ